MTKFYAGIVLGSSAPMETSLCSKSVNGSNINAVLPISLVVPESPGEAKVNVGLSALAS